MANQTLSMVQLGPILQAGRQAAFFEQVSNPPETPAQPPLASVSTG